MKSLSRHLYLACSINPYGLGVICTVAFTVLIFGMLKLRKVVRAIIRHCVACF